MAVSSFLPLVTRVYEVLTLGSGTSRVLAVGDRFGTKIYPGQPRPQRSVAAREAANEKACYVDITAMDLGRGMEMHDRHHYPIDLSIELAYFAEHAVEESKARALMVTQADDVHRVRAALGFPNNLEQTEAAADTGISGGALQFQSASISHDHAAKLSETTLRFTGSISLLFP